MNNLPIKTMSEYGFFLNTFLFNIESLSIYTENVGPVLNKITNKKKFSQVKQISDMIRTIIVSLYNGNPLGLPEETLETLKTIREHYKEKYGLEINNNEVTARGSSAIKLYKEITHFRANENQINIMYQSSLINMIVFIEILIGSLIKNRLMKYPKSNEEIEKKTLTLAEIRNLKSIDNAQAYLIEEEVSMILRKGYKDWIKYIKEKEVLILSNI